MVQIGHNVEAVASHSVVILIQRLVLLVDGLEPVRMRFLSGMVLGILVLQVRKVRLKVTLLSGSSSDLLLAYVPEHLVAPLLVQDGLLELSERVQDVDVVVAFAGEDLLGSLRAEGRLHTLS